MGKQVDKCDNLKVFKRIKVAAYFTFCGPCNVIHLLDKNQQDALFFLNLFQNSILYMFRRD